MSLTPRAAFMQARTPPLPATGKPVAGALTQLHMSAGSHYCPLLNKNHCMEPGSNRSFSCHELTSKRYFASESTSREIPLLGEIPGLGFSVSRDRKVSFWGKQNCWRDTVLSLVFLCRNGIIAVICIKFMIISFEYDSRPFVYKALYCFFRQDIILELWR